MEDKLLASDLLEDIRQQCIKYNEMALAASDDELKKSFLGFHDAEMRLHSQVYNFMKNQGWYVQKAGDLTASGGFRGNFWPHGQGVRVPIDQPDRAYGKTTWEAHNEPRYEGHHYRQQYERSIRNDFSPTPSGPMTDRRMSGDRSHAMNYQTYQEPQRPEFTPNSAQRTERWDAPRPWSHTPGAYSLQSSIRYDSDSIENNLQQSQPQGENELTGSTYRDGLQHNPPQQSTFLSSTPTDNREKR